MSTIQELGAFLTRETTAVGSVPTAASVPLPPAVANGKAVAQP